MNTTKKRSFFDRLSGNNAGNGALDSFDEELAPALAKREPARPASPVARPMPLEDEPVAGEGQLPVDVHQTPSEIIIRAFVAGVRPDELNLSISRDRVEISGSRMEREQIAEPDYFTRELFWGSFSRMIVLPEEIDVENASASAKDGLLTLILPKIDRARQTKLRVKVG
ncbi:Hsp20/alpha crystallin family protein [Candidatus Kaiserbacteria bacterium]|nr:Hsp20/alpha crystallin family protein [Candidatus Kaiserbacteria bacterium]